MKTQEAPKDVALDVPAEANTEKHVNFLAGEETDETSEDVREEETSMENPDLRARQRSERD